MKTLVTTGPPNFYPVLRRPEQVNVVCCALLIAAEQYDRDAETCHDGGDIRTAEAFRKQAKEARELAEALE